MFPIKSFRRTSWTAALAATSVLAVAAPAWATVPATTLVEGVLTSVGGGPAADGSYGITFSLYKDETGGNPAFVEGPVSVGVKNGVFSYPLGTKTKLEPGLLGALGGGWLALKVDQDAELARRPLHAVAYAVRASVAEAVECSGCIGDKQIDANLLAKYAKLDQLSVVAMSGDYKDLKGSPPTQDLSAYPKKTDLKQVAFSGEYKDLTGGPDLSEYKKFADMPAVAQTGAFKDLTAIPKFADVGKACGTGLVLQGIKADGSYDCIGNMDLSAIPPDGIDEISNKLIFNQFVDSFDGTANVVIKDNNPAGVSDIINFPDIGIAQALSVSFDVSNSDPKTVKITVFDPNNKPYVLYDGGSTANPIKGTFPAPNATLSGDLKTWVGKNPVGKWTLQVVDAGFKDNGDDGKITKWTISIQTLSNKKIAIAGDLIVTGALSTGTGGLKINADASTCNAAKTGTLRWDETYGLEACNGTDWAAAIPRPVMWSGGCTSNSTGSGEDTYCLNGVDFNTADKYIGISGGNTFDIKIAGYYRINVWLDGTSCSYRRIYFRINGNQMLASHHYENSGGWYQLIADQMWPFNKGDKLTIISQQDCGGGYYRWHAWANSGSHSRAQLEYAGPLK